jgi:hypothetical protein
VEVIIAETGADMVCFPGSAPGLSVRRALSITGIPDYYALRTYLVFKKPTYPMNRTKSPFTRIWENYPQVSVNFGGALRVLHVVRYRNALGGSDATEVLRIYITEKIVYLGGYMSGTTAPKIARSVTARNVVVIGSGYVGLTLSASLALLGHQVECTDNSLERVAQLADGYVPITESGLTELVEEMLAADSGSGRTTH